MSQSFCLYDTYERSISTSVRFARSVWPSDCGWNAVERFNCVPIIFIRVRQKWPVNLESLSETMALGIPWSLNTWLKNKRATSAAVSVVWLGQKCTCLDNLSTNTVMLSNPREVAGRGPMKSMETVSHRWLGMAKGVNNPAVF